MIFKPAHKQDDPTKKPGQILNQETGHGFTDKTLADYIARKRRADAFDTVAAEKKMTFEEWGQTGEIEGTLDRFSPKTQGIMWELLEKCWKAAQENK